MNILFAVPWDLPQGGVTHVATSLARCLESRGHLAYFLFARDAWLLRRRTSLRGFPAIECRLRSYPGGSASARARLSWYSTVLTTLPQLEWFARAQRIDLVNVHYPESDFALLADIARRLRLPLVVSAHGSDLLTDRGPCRDVGVIRLLESADAVVVPSESYLRSTVALFSCVTEKAQCIYNGYDEAELGPMRELPREAAGAGLVALCIAAHTHKKGIDVLIGAIRACATSSLVLRLVGDGPLRGELEAQAKALGVSQRVFFLGAKSRTDVFAELRRCDMLVMPSRHESFGLAALEAMAFGKPVVASAVGGLAEVVSDGETGIIVPADDCTSLARALDTLACNATLRSRMGKAGRFKAERFTTAATADKYEVLFDALTSRAKPKPAEAVDSRVPEREDVEFRRRRPDPNVRRSGRS